MQFNKDSQPGMPGPANAPTPSGRGNSYLGPGLSIRGEISGNEDLKLDSNVEGLISIGDIVAREALISGQVNGDIRAVDRIEIMKTASIEGDLTTGKITIEEGANFRGSVEVGSSNPQIGTDLDSLLNGAKKTDRK